jgi:signal transduction histidine kinase
VGYFSDQAYEAEEGIAVFTAALMVLFTAVVLWTGSHLNRLDARRSLAEEASKNLARRLAALQESERRALARELHDRIGPNLCALGANLAALGNAPSLEQGMHERIADSIALLEATGVAVSNALSELRPPLLEKRGLLQALRWQAAEFTRRTGISVEVDGADGALNSDLEFEMALFRIAEGALCNVMKHAKARKVSLRLHPSRAVWLEVADDGIGFDPEGTSGAGRLGLTAMRERAEAIDGRLHVQSGCGHGTRIIVGAPAAL